MTDKPETVADVLAEMRSQNLLSTHDWADRIERAREREAKADSPPFMRGKYRKEMQGHATACVVGRAIAPAKASGSAPDSYVCDAFISRLNEDGGCVDAILWKEPKANCIGVYVAQPPASVPDGWPIADQEERELGWNWNYKWLEELHDDAVKAGWYSSMEAIDHVLTKLATTPEESP